MLESGKNPALYRVKLSVDPSTGERWALVEEPPHGVAHAMTTLYGAARLRENGASFNTQLLALGAVAITLNWAVQKKIDLEQRIGACQFFDRGETLDLRRRLRHNFNVEKARSDKARKLVRETVGTATYCNRVRDVCAYVVWNAENVIRRIAPDQAQKMQEARNRLDDFRTMMLSGLPNPKTGGREALDDDERAVFLAAIAPGSATNPFKPPNQRRNDVALRLLDTLGCRRGELLKITVDDLHLHGPRTYVEIVLRQDEVDDPRLIEPRAKTVGRECDVSKELAADLHDFVVHHRSKQQGAKKSRFLFLSRSGQPLSLQALNDMFRLLRARVPGLPEDFTTHIVRHTWNERFSDAADEVGLNEAEEQQARNYSMGWKKGSQQSGAYLLRRTKKKAAEASLRMQAKSWGKTDK